MKTKFLLTLFLNIIFVGCTHSLHLAHVSDFSPTYRPYQQGRLVKAHGEQFVILDFAFETDYVDRAYVQLQKQCPTGDIQGIVTQSITDHGFFSWTNRIEMQGLCIEAKN